MNAELIMALRYCGFDVRKPCNGCVLYDKTHGVDCLEKLHHDAADAIERLTSVKDELIQRICENCETPPDVRLRVCGECPIVKPIREVFDND